MSRTKSTLARVAQLIWADGEISRADVARRLELSRSTVSGLVQQLIDQGSVVEARVGRSSGGRPPVMLRFAHDRYRMIGVDVGISHVTAIAASPRGQVICRRVAAPPVEADPQATLSAIDQLIDDVEAASAHAGRLIGVGVAVPCPVHSDAPGHLSPSILPAWRDIDLGAHIARRSGVPAYLENDANLGALGEVTWGMGRGAGDIAYVKLATGVGAGLMVNGDIYRGAEGIAGELGHTAIDASGPRCRCGLHGCLETLIGSDAIVQHFLARPAPGGSRQVRPTIDAIAEAAAAGDARAAAVVADAGRFLGIALANLLNIVNPARIVLGGDLTFAGDALLTPLRQAIQSRAMWTNVAAADVVVSKLGDDAIPLGAATLVLRTALADPRRLAAGLPLTVPRRPQATAGGFYDHV